MANVHHFTYIFALANFTSGFTTSIPSDKGTRILGGISAAVNSAPFVVSFQKSGIHYCGGSILNQHWVVTAAHCLSSKNQVLSTTLIAGSIYVAGTASTTQKRSIDYYVVHDLYVGGTSPYDIGMVYTKGAFTWTSAVAAINLPTSGSSPSGNAFLWGWGSISKTINAEYPTTLQEATVPIIDRTTCETVLGPKGSDVHTTNLCAGSLTGDDGICTSDSGGPLIQKVNNQNVLIGIISWGKLPCGQVNSPSVFVQVSSFNSWIAENQIVLYC